MLRIIAAIGFVQSLGIAINLVRSKIFAVLLGPAGFGVVATIDQLVLSLVQIFNLSLPFTALKFLSLSHSLGAVSFRRSYAAFAKAIMGLAFLATLVAVIVIPLNLDYFGSQLASFHAPVLIALFGIPATMMLMFFVNVLAACRESIRSVLLIVVSSAIALIAGTIGYLTNGISGIYLYVVIGSTFWTIIVAFYLHSKEKLSIWGDSSGIWQSLFSDSKIVEFSVLIYIAVASAAVQMLVARYVVFAYMSAEAAGLFQACLAISLSIGAVLTPANMLYFSPYINRKLPVLEKVAAADRFLPRLVFLYCMGGLLVLLFPYLFLTLLFSGSFAPAVAILPWLVAWQGLYQISNIYQQLLIGLDDARGYCFVTTIGNLLAALLCVLLVKPYGLIGIAIGFVAGAVLTIALTGLRLRLKHLLSPQYLAATLTAFMVAGFATVVTVGQLTEEISIGGLGARMLTAGVFFAGLWVLLPVTLRSELRMGFADRWHSWTK